METIIVTTDFSASSANALNYAGALAQANGYKLLLVHIYTIPVTYTGEALSLASVNEALETEGEQLENELLRARKLFNEVPVDTSLIVGSYFDTLQELVNELKPAMIIMGAAGAYSELWRWDDDWLNALIAVSCPVLVVPAGVTYRPYKNIAFACDYKRTCMPHQLGIISRLVKMFNATLHIIHVTPEATDITGNKNAEQIKAAFNDVYLQLHVIEDRRIIKTISDFTVRHNIDLLLVMPHRHGLWHSLFNKSYTKQLAQLNHLPVLAVHE